MVTFRKSFDALGGLFDNGNRAYSALNPPTSWTTEKLAADWTNTTTTGSTIFTGFSPAVNTDYEIEALLRVIVAATTTGFQHSLQGATTSVSSTDYAVQLISPTAVTTTFYVNPGVWGAYGSAAAGMTTPNLQRVKALVRVNSTSPTSNLHIRGRSSAAGSEVRVKAGSIMRWRIIG